MINIEEQQKLFARISKKLPRKIEVYAIGGTAMMFLGLKENTLDVDLIFSNPDERKIFKETAKSLGFNDLSAEILYGKKDNSPEMVVISDVRFDLFLFKVISSNFSIGMQKRATQIHEFGNLIIRVADPNDVLIMKSVTSRNKDFDDIVSIINKGPIDWDIIVGEAREQVKLGNEISIMSLGEKLEKLSNQKLISVPKDISDKIWKLFSKQVKEKSKSGKEKSKKVK